MDVSNILMKIRSWWRIAKNYNAVWDKIKNSLNKESDREPVYDNKYIQIKILNYNSKISTDSYGNKIPENNEYCNFLSPVLLDFVAKIDNDYYLQILWEKGKYVMKKKTKRFYQWRTKLKWIWWWI